MRSHGRAGGRLTFRVEGVAALLTVVGTPIGNLDDLSPRAAAALRAAEVVACEDTRRTAVVLRRAESTARMVALHAHNEAARAADLCRRMAEGTPVALVSDAGMPVVSDPGARLVRAAVEAGIGVSVVPGPSAVTAALAVSGLGDGGGFTFAGFFPRRPAERRQLIRRLAESRVPTVGYESPQRLPALLAALADELPDRPVVVARELTKMHEEIVRGGAAEVAARFTAPPRGEITVVVGGGAAGPDAAADLRPGIALLLEAGMGASAAADAAAAFGVTTRNRAYRVALELAEESRRAR